jgi:anthranilate phosphoribosyltransferase
MTSEIQLRDFGRLICTIASGKLMSRKESCEAYRQVILNEQPELQQGAFLMAHITRGPSIEELSGAWDALDCYDTAKINTNGTGPVCDIVGTGSDALKTINCSTPAFLIAAACGIPIAKKGARYVTGVSGASDILELFGIDLNAPLSQAEKCLEKHGICYLPGEAFLKSGWARLICSMRFTSAFNIIGPLTRPCTGTNRIIIGAYAAHVSDQLIAVLREIGMDAALSPYGMAHGIEPGLGMDEFSPCGTTRVVEMRNSTVEAYEVTPDDFGLKPVNFTQIASRNTAQENAMIIMNVLRGNYDCPEADYFCMDAAAALYISDFAKNYAEGFSMAKDALTRGKAYEKLLQLKEFQGIVHKKFTN